MVTLQALLLGMNENRDSRQTEGMTARSTILLGENEADSHCKGPSFVQRSKYAIVSTHEDFGNLG